MINRYRSFKCEGWTLTLWKGCLGMEKGESWIKLSNLPKPLRRWLCAKQGFPLPSGD